MRNNEQIYQIIIVLLRIPNQFTIYKCCEQIQIGFRVGPELMITWIGLHSNGLAMPPSTDDSAVILGTCSLAVVGS